MELIKPKEVVISDLDGVEKTFTISRLPAIACREVIAKYPTSNLPKVGDYQGSEEAMMLLLKYVQVDGIALTTRALINNHITDAIQLVKLEYEMLNYNTGFFSRGDQSGFMAMIIDQIASRITPTLTGLLAQLSPVASPPGKSSKKA